MDIAKGCLPGAFPQVPLIRVDVKTASKISPLLKLLVAVLAANVSDLLATDQNRLYMEITV